MSNNSAISNFKYQISNLANGQVLIAAVLFIFVSTIISLSTFNLVINFVRFGARSVNLDKATVVADAGIDLAIWKINTNSTFRSSCTTSCNITLTTIQGGQFEVSIANSPTAGNKIITATGYVPSQNNKQASRKINVEIRPSAVESFNFPYVLQSLDLPSSEGGGGGPIYLNDKSEVVTGNVYSNDQIITSRDTATINNTATANTTISPNPPLFVGTRTENADPIAAPISSGKINTLTNSIDNDSNVQIINCPIPNPCTINYPQVITIEKPTKYNGDLTIEGQLILKAAIHVRGILTLEATSYFDTLSGRTIITAGSIKLDDSCWQSIGTYVIVDGEVGTEVRFSGPNYFQSTDQNGWLLIASRNASIVLGGDNKAILYAPNGRIGFHAVLTGNRLTGAAVAKWMEANVNLPPAPSPAYYFNYGSGLTPAKFAKTCTADYIPLRGSYKINQ